MSSSLACEKLQTLNEQLAAAQSGALMTSDLVRSARQSEALLAALPEKYALVFNDILDRLESGALFTEESCSFSQRDLLDSLVVWVSKAQATLDKAQSYSG